MDSAHPELDRLAFLGRLEAWRALSTAVQNDRLRSGDDHFEPSTEPDLGRIRAGLWCPCLGLGGAEVWQRSLVSAVDPAKVAWVGAAVLEGRGATDPRMIRELAERMPVGHGTNAARTLAASSDLIISWAVTDVEALLRGLAHRPNVVMACHFPAESPWGPGTEDLLSPVDRLVAVSELAVQSTPVSVRERVEVIWNAIDTARLEVHRDRETMRRAWGIPTESPVVGFIGRLAPEKDPEAMIRMAAELPEPWRVVLVGDGRERERLQRLIESAGLARVSLVGGDPAAGDVLNGFDVLAVPSLYESFGLTLAEGLWMGIPVIATRSGLARLVPGLVREVQVGASGREWSEALLADFADIEATRIRVDRARSFVQDHLTIKRFGREWTELLTGLARSGKGGAR